MVKTVFNELYVGETIMRKVQITIYLLIVLLLSSTLYSQDKMSIEYDYENPKSDWRFIISPYAWLAGQATDVGGEQLRQSFNDLASLTNFGFQLNATVMYKNFIFTSDGTYANLGGNLLEGPLTVDLDIKQYMLDLKLGYLIVSDLDLDENDVIMGWALEINIGAKYWKNDVTLDYNVQINNPPPLVEGSIKEPQAWWDLMLGVKSRIFLSESVLLGITGNIGGFGIGNSSKLSWDFTYANTFKVSNLISVTAGYRAFKYNREDGEGDERLETTVHAFGPMLGVSFVF